MFVQSRQFAENLTVIPDSSSRCDRLVVPTSHSDKSPHQWSAQDLNPATLCGTRLALNRWWWQLVVVLVVSFHACAIQSSVGPSRVVPPFSFLRIFVILAGFVILVFHGHGHPCRGILSFLSCHGLRPCLRFCSFFGVAKLVFCFAFVKLALALGPSVVRCRPLDGNGCSDCGAQLLFRQSLSPCVKRFHTTNSYNYLETSELEIFTFFD